MLRQQLVDPLLRDVGEHAKQRRQIRVVGAQEELVEVVLRRRGRSAGTFDVRALLTQTALPSDLPNLCP